MEAEQKAGLKTIGITQGTFNDCKSALNKFIIFLTVIMHQRMKSMQSGLGLTASCGNVYSEEQKNGTFNFMTKNNTLQDDIVWEKDTKSTLNAKTRILSQDRLNSTKEVCFPISAINQIANNADKWAIELGLPSSHPARKIKKVLEDVVDKMIDSVVFNTENGAKFELQSISCIGIKELESGEKHVYVKTQNSDIYQVMSRKADKTIVPMVLAKGENYSNIHLDHVIRMEEILAIFAVLFPFLKELTDLFRKLKVSSIKSKERRQAVIAHIKDNFSDKYASEMGQLSKELEIPGKLIKLEVIYHKDNMEKH